MSNQVPVKADSLPQPSEAASILSVIERAARSPDVDVDKMERLLLMHERIVGKQAETAFNAALTAAQSNIGRVAADANNQQTRSRYASYAALDRMLRPVYIGQGLALSFDTTDSPTPDHIRVLCHVSHVAGHTRTYHVDMPNDGKGAKGGDVMTKTHATGAAMSYGARYLLKMIFNVAVGEDDTDGNIPGERVSKEQAANIETLATEVGANIQMFLRYMKASSISEIQAKNYENAIAALKRKRSA